MPTNSDNLIGTFIVGRLLAENAGLRASEATQFAAVLMAMGLSPASILLVLVLARRDAAQQSANPTLADLQAELAQILAVSRQTNQTVVQIQQVNLQAAASARTAAQAAQRAVDLAKIIIARLRRLLPLSYWCRCCCVVMRRISRRILRT